MSPGGASEGLNGFWRDFGYHHRHTRLRNHPAVLAIESTNHCNLRCVMCPRGEPDVMERELGTMSDALFSKVLDDARYFSSPCWFHWFGEPLLNPRLFDQIAYAKSRGVPNLGISTNGTLLNASRARALLESPLDTLMIAIDGATKEVYERVRISALFTFEQVVDNARSFLALRHSLGRKTPRTILSIIVMRETQGELDAFRNFWLALGADEVLFKPFTTWASQSADIVPLATIEDQINAPVRRTFPCSHLWESLVITWNGLVVPCCYDYNAKQVMGDLNHQTLWEIWNGLEYQELRRKELNGCNDSPLCAGCTQAPGHPQNPLWPLPFRPVGQRRPRG